MTVTSTPFHQDIGREQDNASANFIELITKGCIARPVEELDYGTLLAIANGSVGPQYAHLDALLKGWTP